MKFKIIFCLLFVLINSKKEFNPFFEKTVNILSKSYNSDSLGETDYCGEASTKDQCLAITNPKQNFQCCYMITKIDEISAETCQEFTENIESFKKFINLNSYKAVLKEEFGYLKYVQDQSIAKTETNANCKNGQFSISIGYDVYSQNELTILKDSNLCLNKYYLKITNKDYDVGKCEEGLLLDSSKSVGLECGYFLINAKINSEKSISYKTCFFFNLDYLSGLTTIEPETFDSLVQSIVLTHGYSSFESYTVEFYDVKGKKVTYDSTTKKTIIDDPDVNPDVNPASPGYMLTISKYIFLFFLILF